MRRGNVIYNIDSFFIPIMEYHYDEFTEWERLYDYAFFEPKRACNAGWLVIL